MINLVLLVGGTRVTSSNNQLTPGWHLEHLEQLLRPVQVLTFVLMDHKNYNLFLLLCNIRH